MADTVTELLESDTPVDPDPYPPFESEEFTEMLTTRREDPIYQL